MLQESPGLVVERVGSGMPSSTYNALLEFWMDFAPRITTLVSAPAPADVSLIWTPASLPAREFTMLASRVTKTLSSSFWTL